MLHHDRRRNPAAYRLAECDPPKKRRGFIFRFKAGFSDLPYKFTTNPIQFVHALSLALTY